MKSEIHPNDINFHQLIEHSLNSIWLVEKKGKVLYCNKACLDLLKLASSKDILYKSFYTFLHPDFYASCKDRLTRIMEKQEVAKLAEEKMITSDGEVIDVSVMGVPLFKRQDRCSSHYSRHYKSKKSRESFRRQEKFHINWSNSSWYCS